MQAAGRGLTSFVTRKGVVQRLQRNRHAFGDPRPRRCARSGGKHRCCFRCQAASRKPVSAVHSFVRFGRGVGYGHVE